MKFYIKQKVFSFKDQFTVKDLEGNDVYKVQGKVFSLKNKLSFQDLEEKELLRAEKKLFRFLQEYVIFSANNEPIAVVKRKFGFRPKFLVSIGNQEYNVTGSFFQHSFEVLLGDEIVSSITKKVISWGDSYEIDIYDETHLELNLFIVIIIDQVIHEQQRRSRSN